MKGAPMNSCSRTESEIVNPLASRQIVGKRSHVRTAVRRVVPALMQEPGATAGTRRYCRYPALMQVPGTKRGN